MIKVLVAGFDGSMGNKTTNMVIENDKFELAGVFSPFAGKDNLREYTEFKDQNVPVYKTYEEVAAHKNDFDVWVDFTVPSAVYQNVKFAIENKISPVVGTTGLTDEQLVELKALAKENKVGGLIAPNFGISAVLLMQFAKKAAEFMPDVEIIELHHDNKLDAPSGTAVQTAKMISEVRTAHHQGNPNEKETMLGARGADFEGMKIHSVRLPGYVAHEQVIFGSLGESLTIRQDSFDRSSFMTGVALAVEKIGNYNELLVGLENLL